MAAAVAASFSQAKCAVLRFVFFGIYTIDFDSDDYIINIYVIFHNRNTKIRLIFKRVDCGCGCAFAFHSFEVCNLQAHTNTHTNASRVVLKCTNTNRIRSREFNNKWNWELCMNCWLLSSEWLWQWLLLYLLLIQRSACILVYSKARNSKLFYIP